MVLVSLHRVDKKDTMQAEFSSDSAYGGDLAHKKNMHYNILRSTAKPISAFLGASARSKGQTCFSITHCLLWNLKD